MVAAAARKFELYNNVTPLSINPLEWNVSDNEKSKMFQHTCGGGGVKGAVFLRLCRLFRFLHKFRLLRMLHWPHTCACPFVQTQITREIYAEGKLNLIFQRFPKRATKASRFNLCAPYLALYCQFNSTFEGIMLRKLVKYYFLVQWR